MGPILLYRSCPAVSHQLSIIDSSVSGIVRVIDEIATEVVASKFSWYDPVLIYWAPIATARSAITELHVSPLLWETMTFSLNDDKDQEMKQILATVYGALKEKGYNPINQIVGYILSEDPTYITNHNNARSLICKLDRDEVMSAMIKKYLDIKDWMNLLEENYGWKYYWRLFTLQR